ncbi:MAG: hypothetical protein JJU00_14615 [Opitutales bacterium]|nr:hypothetical protein [Opitutales bacterium]
MKIPHLLTTVRRAFGASLALAVAVGASLHGTATVHNFQTLSLGPIDGQGAWAYPDAPLPQDQVLVAPGGLYWIGGDDGIIPGGTQHLRTRAGLDGNGRMNPFLSLGSVSVSGTTYVRFLVRLDQRPGGVFGTDAYEFFYGFAQGTGGPWNAYGALKLPATGDEGLGVETTNSDGVLPNPKVVLDETLLVVTRFNTNGAGELTGIDVWLNPAHADSGTPDHSVVFDEPGADLSQKTNFNVRAQNMPMALDSLVFADSWGEVVPPAYDGTPRAPVVLLPPASPEGEIGEIGELSVLVWEEPGNPVTGYQWLLNQTTEVPAGFGGTASPIPFQFWTAFGATNPLRLAAHNPDAPRTGSLMRVRVTNAEGSTLTPNVRIREARAPEPPEITRQPVDAEFMDNDTVIFDVEVFSLIDVTYQWFLDGEPIDGATGRQLRINNATAADAGTYAVEVTNDLGTERSDDAVLTYDDGSFPEDARVVWLSRGSELGESIAAAGMVDDQIGADLSPHDPADEPPTIASISVADFNSRIGQAYAEGRGGVFDFNPGNFEKLSGRALTQAEIDGNRMGAIKRFVLDLGGGEIETTPIVRFMGAAADGYIGRDFPNPNFITPLGFYPRSQTTSGEVIMTEVRSQESNELGSSPTYVLGANSYIKFAFDPADKVDLVGFVFINRDYFQSHRSTKAYPDKPNIRATARFTNGSDTVSLISTGTTAQGDGDQSPALGYNTFFGFESPGEDYYLKDIDVWALGNNFRCIFSIDDLAVAVAELPVDDDALDAWLAFVGVPADRRGPADRNGPLQLTNLEAYAMGIPPLTATSADLPRTERDPADPNQVSFTYRVNTAAEGVTTSILQSADLQSWNPASPITDAVVSTDGDIQWREAVFAVDAETPLFLQFGAELDD